MNPPTCIECLTACTDLDERDVCPACVRRLELLAEYERGERTGWRAAVDFYEITP